MKTKAEEMPLADQLRVWSLQMDVLIAKQEAAAVAAMNAARELIEFRSKFRMAAEQLRKNEMKESGLNMWENIGDGG